MTPTFDTWTSGFLLAVAMGLFLFVLLVTGKTKKNLPIAFLVLAFSVILFQYVLYWTKYNLSFPYLNFLPNVCYYTTGPLLYLYFLNLYKKKVSFNYMLHFLPAFLAFVIYSGNLFYIVDPSMGEVPLLWFLRNPWLIAIHMGCYAVLCGMVMRMDSGVSAYKKLRDNWSRMLLLLYSAFVLSYLSYFILVNFSFFSSEWDYSISILMTLSIYAIGYFIFKEPRVFDGEFYTSLFLPDTNKDNSFEESLLNEFYTQVTTYMESKKPYMDNELRLVNLADQMGFSLHLLSRVINIKSGNNFNGFVNAYRLRHAEKLLLNNPEFSIKTIYFEVGFNNKATFYKAFKEEYGCTPKEFRENVLNELQEKSQIL